MFTQKTCGQASYQLQLCFITCCSLTILCVAACGSISATYLFYIYQSLLHNVILVLIDFTKLQFSFMRIFIYASFKRQLHHRHRLQYHWCLENNSGGLNTCHNKCYSVLHTNIQHTYKRQQYSLTSDGIHPYFATRFSNVNNLAKYQQQYW